MIKSVIVFRVVNLLFNIYLLVNYRGSKGPVGTAPPSSATQHAPRKRREEEEEEEEEEKEEEEVERKEKKDRKYNNNIISNLGTKYKVRS